MTSVELKVPNVGESITEVQIGTWLKQEGDAVGKDEAVVEIETDKVTVEVTAPEAGVLGKVLKPQGEQAVVGDIIGVIESNGQASEAPQAAKPAREAQPAPTQPQAPSAEATSTKSDEAGSATSTETAAPAADRAKPDSEQESAQPSASGTQSPAAAPAPAAPPPAPRPAPTKTDLPPIDPNDAELVPMTPMRRRIAERLVEAQQTAAILTTYNEVDMSEVIALRKEYKDAFEQRYGVKLGFMSFFVKAVIEGLKEVPQVNAQIHGNSIAYFKKYDIGVAVGGGKGLVVPVIRNADRLGFGQIEQTISSLATRAKANKLELHELQGGTFTISNGGIYGSMLSTPILNPPQSGILGLHAIQERPVARNGQVVIRPMMYLALSYDHRLIDGREAVTFLKRVKETIETPLRIMIEL